MTTVEGSYTLRGMETTEIERARTATDDEIRDAVVALVEATKWEVVRNVEAAGPHFSDRAYGWNDWTPRTTRVFWTISATVDGVDVLDAMAPMGAGFTYRQKKEAVVELDRVRSEIVEIYTSRPYLVTDDAECSALVGRFVR